MNYSWNLRNCCFNKAFTLFQPRSAGNNLRHFITVPWDFTIANSLGLHLVTTAIFSSFKIQSKQNLGFPSKVGILTVRESFALSHWEWWITYNTWVVSFFILCWHCNKSVSELTMAVLLCLRCLYWWVCQLCLCHLPNSDEEQMSEPPPLRIIWWTTIATTWDSMGTTTPTTTGIGIMSTFIRRITWASISISTISSWWMRGIKLADLSWTPDLNKQNQTHWSLSNNITPVW